MYLLLSLNIEICNIHISMVMLREKCNTLRPKGFVSLLETTLSICMTC